MRKYETPELKAVYFDVDDRIMVDGYDPGDIVENPWADLFKEESGGDVAMNASEFDA